jgi:CRISPR system Cascade subunit CasE
VLSRTPPQDKKGIFLLETKPFAPRLAAGQRLGFRLRANPTVFSHGKRHDVLMHAKKQLPDRENVGLDEKAKVMDEAAINWLCNAMRTASWGISIDVAPVILSQRQNQTIKTNSDQNISFTSVDYEGVLSVTDPERLITTIENGVGKARAFGCGLLLLRRL